ncbi:TPA: hypothetical protein ACWMI6_005978 [Pseudomonas aeruginosa]|nr:hypothetical protein [Pseudomonas aeruginosa]
MSKHTPGPWVLDTIPTSVGICHRIGPFPPRRPDDVKVRHACLYADYPSASNPADEELEANARLIAAAPELLEALQHIEEYWNRDSNEQAMTDALWHIIETAQAAIAKATA